VARALLGRRAGARVPAALPDSSVDELHVVAVRAARSAS
jgi:transcription elongation GreA/GreB family factor